MNCLAPMVDGSDYPYREYIQHFGVTHFWTPMYNVSVFLQCEELRSAVLSTLRQERRSVVFQLAGRDPEHFERVCELVRDISSVSHVELNLGCAQAIAQRAGYGSYLEDERLILAILGAMRGCGKRLAVKLRFRGGVDGTRRFVRELVSAGCDLISLHARDTKVRLGCGSGDCRMEEALDLLQGLSTEFPTVQFVYNGGIFTHNQVEHVHARGIGVMCGQAILTDPLLFLSGKAREDAESIIECASQAELTVWSKMRGEVAAAALDTSKKAEIVANSGFDPRDVQAAHQAARLLAVLLAVPEVQSAHRVEYVFHDLRDSSDIFQTMSAEKTSAVLRGTSAPILFFTKRTKLLHVKSVHLLLEAFLRSISGGFEWSTAALIGHAMGIFGRDLMRCNVDLRDLVVGKRHRALQQFQGDEGPRNWALFKIECIRIAAFELARRLEADEGVPADAKSDEM